MSGPEASSGGRPLNVFLVVGEESGDQLGAGLMRALASRHSGEVRFHGVGGAAMAAEGMTSLFPLADLAVMGVVAVAMSIPTIYARIRATVRAVVATKPDVLVIVDSPDFTHQVARRVRAAAPDIPIVDYVSPSVWAWRSGRARAMRAYVDHVLALLPFEPDVHAALGGPPCTYVGHPLAERISELRPGEDDLRRRNADPPLLLVLPGSRRGEVRRLLAPFEEAVERVRARAGTLDVVMPTVPHLAGEVSEAAARWRVPPRVVVDAAAKRAAFRRARAALAASGTVTLELALAAVPMVAAYRVAPIEAAIARLALGVSPTLKDRIVPSVILTNLILNEIVVPEFLQENCTPDRLADALLPLLSDTPERRRQLKAFARLDDIMQIGRAEPSRRAAEAVLALARKTA